MSLPTDPKQLWSESFEEQITRGAYNTAPVEAVVRTVSYYLRDRYRADALPELRFLEIGCGAGANLVWLAEKGIRVTGVDIAANALRLARANLERHGFQGRVDELLECGATETPFPDQSFDGIVEACVFQHLARPERLRAFAEVGRLLREGGLFVGYMLDVGHSIFRKRGSEQLTDDPGTLVLAEGGSRVYLSNIGLSHFFRREEIIGLLEGFSEIDPCLSTYFLPRDEARRRGYSEYLQSMWTVYAVK
jgi:SAM-dependent methyltransferase